MLYTVKEAAELLKVTAQTVRFWIRDGKISAVRVGVQWRIPEKEIQRITGEK